ncbi:MAG: murein biosynthesis integral membrane protein MurJ [Candidatus Wildermuthbacteria bacterium RIFCSPHIGHO2_01_FULL_47_27]|uniref:Probable lipid II flippase MurJ n=1 Tax=Candidatus Wildermuthbacteria bacterium RIFCSPLOWO2_01_FULL_48_35 TaxID=1802463 RepID=A0A1G2RMH5_9BACT|nr:MAG: murein biosynthesis integral membrane protein MurJ [Candidatus Wildermuthbacteria bacterium RIFCSPHIGHO2_01_FULL_47_27]OHA73698.1 MAG: murein biosynthesis integral membrane protein MurJ [Candidatus Wildermuthbacteria bacterium RIFCSPLOWO2_01_FULL_48_35]
MAKISRIFNSQAKTVTFAAFLLAVSALASRLLGLARDRLLAGTFGAGPELDIYFAAFRVPDFIYALLITGGISAVFLPVFSGIFQHDSTAAWKFVNNALDVFSAGLVALCVVLALFTPLLVYFIAPGFSGEQKEITILLTRIMFLSPIIFGIASIFSGVLHYFNKFLIYSLAPVLYNLGIILGIVFFVPYFGLQGLAFGVILGAFLYLAVQIPAAVNSGWSFKFAFQPRDPSLRKMFRLMLPRTLGTSAYQLNLFFITAYASTLGAGSIAVFNFSNNLQYFPIGLIGISFAMAVFPALSRSWAQNNKEKFLHQFHSVFGQVLFLAVPVSVLMFLLRAQIVRLILGTGQFGWLETRLVAASLGVFALGIFAASLVPLLARAFFSLHDTRTPAYIGVAAVIQNIAFSFLFVWVFAFPNIFREIFVRMFDLPDINDVAIIALPLAISLSGIIQFILLMAFLGVRIGGLRMKEVRRSAQKIIVAGFACGVAVYFAIHLATGFLDTRTFFGVFGQTAAAAIAGTAAYLAAAYFLRVPELAAIWSSVVRQIPGQSRKVIA